MAAAAEKDKRGFFSANKYISRLIGRLEVATWPNPLVYEMNNCEAAASRRAKCWLGRYVSHAVAAGHITDLP
jgi:hypothetical protein